MGVLPTLAYGCPEAPIARAIGEYGRTGQFVLPLVRFASSTPDARWDDVTPGASDHFSLFRARDGANVSPMGRAIVNLRSPKVVAALIAADPEGALLADAKGCDMVKRAETVSEYLNLSEAHASENKRMSEQLKESAQELVKAEKASVTAESRLQPTDNLEAATAFRLKERALAARLAQNRQAKATLGPEMAALMLTKVQGDEGLRLDAAVGAREDLSFRQAAVQRLEAERERIAARQGAAMAALLKQLRAYGKRVHASNALERQTPRADIVSIVGRLLKHRARLEDESAFRPLAACTALSSFSDAGFLGYIQDAQRRVELLVQRAAAAVLGVAADFSEFQSALAGLCRREDTGAWPFFDAALASCDSKALDAVTSNLLRLELAQLQGILLRSVQPAFWAAATMTGAPPSEGAEPTAPGSKKLDAIARQRVAVVLTFQKAFPAASRLLVVAEKDEKQQRRLKKIQSLLQVKDVRCQRVLMLNLRTWRPGKVPGDGVDFQCLAHEAMLQRNAELLGMVLTEAEVEGGWEYVQALARLPAAVDRSGSGAPPVTLWKLLLSLCDLSLMAVLRRSGITPTEAFGCPPNPIAGVITARLTDALDFATGLIAACAAVPGQRWSRAEPEGSLFSPASPAHGPPPIIAALSGRPVEEVRPEGCRGALLISVHAHPPIDSSEGRMIGQDAFV